MNFDSIFAAMVAYLQNVKSRLTDFTPTSILGQILSAISSVIDGIYYSITDARNQAYIQTATDTGLDAKGSDVGVIRKPAIASQWYFTFSRDTVSSLQQPIPAGTIITTIQSQGQDPITFATNADSFLGVGTLEVDVLATCETPGALGNISIDTPLLIGSALPGIDGVALNSLNNGTYGSDIEDDESYRTRIMAALASKAQGTVTWYEQTSLSVAGVQSCKVVPLGRGPGSVDIYIIGSGNVLPSQSLINSVQQEIDSQRLITDDAKVFPPSQLIVDRNVSILIDTDYNEQATISAVQAAIKDYIDSLGIGGGSTGTLYVSQVIKTALSVNGVMNATSSDSDVTFTQFQLPTSGNIVVTSI